MPGCRFLILLILSFLFHAQIIGSVSEDLVEQYYEVQDRYMSLFPGSSHSERCVAIEPGAAVILYYSRAMTDVTALNGSMSLITTPCLGTDSLGNRLGAYFESIVCAERVGMHFLSMSKIWERGDSSLKKAPFLLALPSIIQHRKPVDRSTVDVNLRKICRCRYDCHERNEALWVEGLPLIRPILAKAINWQYKYLLSAKESKEAAAIVDQATIVQNADTSNAQVGAKLPLIPDIAIHYRCGDNFAGNYGFLPWKALTDRLPVEENLNIFILSEERNRHLHARTTHADKCDLVLSNLLHFLQAVRPNCTVSLRRGDNVYVDIVRLAFARVTICSVSTFCLWPAIVRKGLTYVPVSRVLVQGNSSIDLGFKWIEEPAVVMGRAFAHLPVQVMLNHLHPNGIKRNSIDN